MNQLRPSAFISLVACVLVAACSATAAAPSPTPSNRPIAERERPTERRPTERLATSSAICGLELPYALEPRWMNGVCSIDPRYLVHVDPSNSAALYASWAPDVSARGPDASTPRNELPVVEVTGQYDHPAAQRCRAVVPSGTPSADLPDPDSIVLNCRRQFVITAIRKVED